MDTDETSIADETDVMAALFECAPHLHCIANAAGELVHVNAAFEALGYTRSELCAHSFLDLVHPDDRPLTRAAHADLVTTGRAEFENRIRRKDGSYRRTAWTCSRSPTGHLSFSIGREAGEPRVAMERECRCLCDELERQKHQYQAIFDTLPQMILLKDTENRILCANSSGARSLGVPPGAHEGLSELEGLSEWDCHPRQAEQYHRDDLEVIQEGRPKLDIVEPFEPRPGDVQWLRTDKTPYLDDAGVVRGVVVSAADVTAWKRAEEERARVYEQLKQLDELKTHFFANVSHELRTPLTLVLGPVEKLLTDAGLNPEQKRELAVVHRNARLLYRHVHDLLDITKIDAGKMDLVRVPVDLNDLVRATLEPFAILARERNIVMTLDVAGPAFGFVDGTKVRRIVGNILADALRHAPDGGAVRCSLKTVDGRMARIEIADSGAGIPPSARHAIFDRFHQKDDGGRRRGGTGLGLAIAKELTTLHGGDIEVATAPEGGALFTIRLPLGAPHSSSAHELEATRPPTSWEGAGPIDGDLATDISLPAPAFDDAADPEHTQALIVVVDESAEMLLFIARALSKNFRVACAKTAEDGLRLARESKADVVLTDLMSPHRERMDGTALVRSLRADPALRTIPILLLTARPDEETIIRALEAGADDCLTKPFTPRELEARLSAHLQLVWIRQRVARAEEEAAHLRSTIEARDEFLTMTAHELRTPLSALQLNLQWLERLSPAANEQLRAERFAVAMRSCKHMTRFVDMLLELARVATGHMQLDKVEVDFAELIDELARRFQNEVRAAGSTLEVRMGGPAVGYWDRARLEHVFSNLLTNAIKFGMGRPIELGYTVDAERLHVSVRDHGVGIAPEDQSRIFQSFEHATGARSHGGLGLGLWLANDIVERHHGELHLASALGDGSTFTVDLPRAYKS